MMAGRIREYAFCRTMDSLHNNHPDMQGTMQSVKETTELRQWFVMRDLKREMLNSLPINCSVN